MRRPKNKKNFEAEFEGLSSFEEIDSYSVLKSVVKNGKRKFDIIHSKNNKQKNKNETQKKETNAVLNSTKSEDKTDKRKLEENEDVPNKKPKYVDVNKEAWRSIFVPEIILDAICELGFKEPTTIQKLTLPAAIEGRKDIVGAAETGSGKTLAFMIPIIHGILRDQEMELNEPESSEEEVEEELLEEEVEESEDEGDVDGQEEEESDVEEEDDDLDVEEDEDDDLDVEEDDSDAEEDGEDEEDEDGDLDVEEEEEEEDEEVNYKGRRNIGCVKVINNANFDFMKLKDKDTTTSKLRALVITPTRELAVQIKKHTDAVLTKTNIKTALVIGGLSLEKQERVLSKSPEIVIGTPGRLWEMIQNGNRHLSFMNSVRYLAIDETDRMLEKGNFEELNHILEQMNCFPEERKKRQNFIFSATLTLTHDAPKRLKNKKVEKISSEEKLENFIKSIGLRTKPKIVDITRKFGTAESLSETKVFCEKEEKDVYLYYFLKRFPGRTLIFCNSINCIKRLSNLLTMLRCRPQTLHASKQQRQRLKSLERFAANDLSVLLATDVAARGIDIPGIKHIIHYEVPLTAEIYVHRSGRTARANQEGVSVLLISSEEANKYRQLCSTLNRSTDLPNFPVDHDLLDNTRSIVHLAKEVEVLQYRQDKKKKDELWLKKIKEETGLQRDQSSDDEDDVAINAIQKRKQTNQIKMKLAQLSELLSKPLISSAFSGRYPTMTGKLVLPNHSLLKESNEGAIELVKQKNKVNHSVIPKSNKAKRRKNKRNKKNKKNNKNTS